MKKSMLLVAASIMCLSLASCGTTSTTSTEEITSQAETTSENEVNINLNDTRLELYTAVYGSYEDGIFTSYEEDQNFKSFYEAVSDCFYNGEYGSYVYAASDENASPLYIKRASHVADYSDSTPADQWFWYNSDMELDGHYGFITGFTDLYKNENYAAIYSTKDNFAPSYQPYSIIGTDNDSATTTPAWNLEPYLDSRVVYNPLAFSGIQQSTYTFDLTESKIRPSYSETQKAYPEVCLSTTDSYNSSKQGLFMDTDNGNWYYFYGESQSQSKVYQYEYDDVIMTSTWDEENQEFTPDGDVTLELETIWDEENEIIRNDLDIQIAVGSDVTNFERSYEYVNMTACGTHRASVGLDLMPTDGEEEDLVLPDYMCGSYFNNIVISNGEGTVKEGLSILDYTQDFACEAGTYDLLNSSEMNSTKIGTILDGSSNISYDISTAGQDVYNISYAQKDSASSRSDAISSCESSLDQIADEDTSSSASVIVAKSSYDKLSKQEQNVIKQIDKYLDLLTRVGIED
jgi:hypothetical protein